MGLSAHEVVQLGAAMAAEEAVPSSSKCQHDGCEASATVLCHGCCTGGRFLCEQHDTQVHQWAHTHRRDGLLNGFKEPLRPTQLQSEHLADEGQYNWVDVLRVFDQPPSQPCACSTCSWQLDSSSSNSSSSKRLNIITTLGKHNRPTHGSACQQGLQGLHVSKASCGGTEDACRHSFDTGGLSSQSIN